MKKLIKMSSVIVTMANKTNGATTTYTIRIIPSTKIHAGDVFKIEFPKELSIDHGHTCGTRSSKGRISPLKKVTCQRVGLLGMHFTIADIDAKHVAGVALELTVSDVTNARSLRPSSSFQDIRFTDSENANDLSDYPRKVFVIT